MFIFKVFQGASQSVEPAALVLSTSCYHHIDKAYPEEGFYTVLFSENESLIHEKNPS